MYFGNCTPIHFDCHYTAQTEFRKPLVDSIFTAALVTGQSVIDVSQNVFANLGWDEVRLPNPVFEGDTIYSQSEVLEKRESKSRKNVGMALHQKSGLDTRDSSSVLSKPPLVVVACNFGAKPVGIVTMKTSGYNQEGKVVTRSSVQSWSTSGATRRK